MKKVIIDFNEQRGRVWIGKGGGSCAIAIPLGDIPRGNEVSETTDRRDALFCNHLTYKSSFLAVLVSDTLGHDLSLEYATIIHTHIITYAQCSRIKNCQHNVTSTHSERFTHHNDSKQVSKECTLLPL